MKNCTRSSAWNLLSCLSERCSFLGSSFSSPSSTALVSRHSARPSVTNSHSDLVSTSGGLSSLRSPCASSSSRIHWMHATDAMAAEEGEGGRGKGGPVGGVEGR